MFTNYSRDKSSSGLRIPYGVSSRVVPASLASWYLAWCWGAGTVKTDASGDEEPVVWSTETGYWRVTPQPHEGIKEGQTSLEVLLADPAGRVTVYVGAAGEGRIDLASDVIARTTSGAEVAASSRMYGNVAGELMWVHSLAAFGNPLQSYVSAQLARVEKE